LGPLQKQLRSLVQIEQGITAYFQAKEEINGLISHREAVRRDLEKLRAEFDIAIKTTAEELRAFREDAKNTREKDIRERKEALNGVEEEIRLAQAALGKKRGEIGSITNTYNRRVADQDAALEAKEKEHAEKIRAMHIEQVATSANLEHVKEQLATFLKEHGLAAAVPIEPAPAENVL
jgi:flagellar motility protein MotE (MotC chaperone)